MFRTLLVALLFAYVAAFAPVSSRMVSDRKISMLNVGDVAPDFSLKTYDGKEIKLSSFKVGWLLFQFSVYSLSLLLTVYLLLS